MQNAQSSAVRLSRHRGLRKVAAALIIFAFAAFGIGLAAHHDASATTTVTRSGIASLAGKQVGNNCSPYAGACSMDWCAIFAEWVWRTAGVSDVPTSAVATDVGSWGQQRGLFKARPAGGEGNPLPGDIVVFGQPGSGSGGHVAIVESVNPDGTITTVNGNYNGTTPSNSHVVRTTINPVTARSGARDVPISGYVSPPGVSTVSGSVAQPVCRAVVGDWDGVNGDSLGVACAGGTAWSWNLMNVDAGGSPQVRSNYGSTSCLPVTGDWNGDGRATVGVACKNGNGIAWYLSDGLAGSPTHQLGFGNSDSCLPVTGEWNGDGRTTVGVACKNGNGISWYLSDGLSGGSPTHQFGFGNSDSCLPVTGDWNGDGRTTVGVACKNGNGISWYLSDGLSGGSPTYQFGFGNSSSCEPVTGDFNNDRHTTIGVACHGGSSISWKLMNILAGGSPQITAEFGNGGFFQPASGSWYGAGWPGWPTN